MEVKNSLPFSEKPIIGPYSEKERFINCINYIQWSNKVILNEETVNMEVIVIYFEILSKYNMEFLEKDFVLKYSRKTLNSSVKPLGGGHTQQQTAPSRPKEKLKTNQGPNLRTEMQRPERRPTMCKNHTQSY
jgi:hypothetical protein